MITCPLCENIQCNNRAALWKHFCVSHPMFFQFARDVYPMAIHAELLAHLIADGTLKEQLALYSIQKLDP